MVDGGTIQKSSGYGLIRLMEAEVTNPLDMVWLMEAELITPLDTNW